MKDFYNNNKKLCLVIAALLLFALCRMAIYDRKYYVSKNRYVVINRVTGSCWWHNPERKVNSLEKIYNWCNSVFTSKNNNLNHDYANDPDALWIDPTTIPEK